MKKQNTFLRRLRIRETCLKNHINENNSDFYKTLTVYIVITVQKAKAILVSKPAVHHLERGGVEGWFSPGQGRPGVWSSLRGPPFWEGDQQTAEGSEESDQDSKRPKNAVTWGLVVGIKGDSQDVMEYFRVQRQGFDLLGSHLFWVVFCCFLFFWVRVINKDINKNKICSAWFNGRHRPWS